MSCYAVYFSGKFFFVVMVMSASFWFSVRRISRRLRVAWIAASFSFLKGIFLGWFVRGKKKNNKDKNKKFLVSFFQCQGFGGRRMCEEAMGSSSSSSLKWRWLNLSGSRVRRRRRRWEEERRNGICFRWLDGCRGLWVAGTVEGHRQIDRQTETEEYMRSCEGRGNYLSSYIISLVLSACGRPFHPSVPSSVPSSIHSSSSSRKKEMMEEEEDEWRQQQFIQMFMWSNPVFMKNSCSLAICQKLQTNF